MVHSGAMGKRAVPKEPAAEPSGSTAMDRGEVSKMITLLKYHDGPKSKAGVEYKSQASKALAVYSNLAPDKKHDFLSKFKKRRGRDLSSVQQLTDQQVYEETTETGITKGWFIPSEILQLNGLQMKDFKDHA